MIYDTLNNLPTQSHFVRQLPQSGSPWQNDKVSGFAKASPFGRGVTERDGEGEAACGGAPL